MKNLLLFVFTAVMVSCTMTSCKKSYTCDCENIKGEKNTRSVVATNINEARTNCNEYGLAGHCVILE